MRLVFEDQGWEDYTSWLKTDRKMLARINKLVEDVRRDPFTGIGKPEPLKYHLPGAWSRRIDDEHRLVYVVTESEIIILAARYHYLPHRAIRRARSRRRPGTPLDHRRRPHHLQPAGFRFPDGEEWDEAAGLWRQEPHVVDARAAAGTVRPRDGLVTIALAAAGAPLPVPRSSHFPPSAQRSGVSLDVTTAARCPAAIGRARGASIAAGVDLQRNRNAR